MSLAYNAETDRLDDGSYFTEFKGRPVLQMLLSMRRAKALFEASKELQEHYDALPKADWASERPFSSALAVLELESFPVMYGGEQREITIDQLFQDPALAQAPPEYRNLCQIVLFVPGLESLADSEGVHSVLFPRQLFRTLGCAHAKVRTTFTRQTGSCLGPTQLTPAGEVIDIYYMTRSSEAKARFDEFRKADVREGLRIAVNAALHAGADAEKVIALAAEAYRSASGAMIAGSPAGRLAHGDWHAAIESLTDDLTRS